MPIQDRVNFEFLLPKKKTFTRMGKKLLLRRARGAEPRRRGHVRLADLVDGAEGLVVGELGVGHLDRGGAVDVGGMFFEPALNRRVPSAGAE